jgi:tetratricopeptide (TPR) repeat protein
MRSGIQTGSRGLNNVSLGISYNYLGIVSLDYGFSLPLGGIKNTGGSHRICLVFTFGKIEGSIAGMEEDREKLDRAVASFNNGEYFTAYDRFQQLVDSQADKSIRIKSADYIKKIVNAMQSDILKKESEKKVAYAKGFLNYKEKMYKESLSQLQKFLKYEPYNEEILHYIDLLSKMLGMDQNKQNNGGYGSGNSNGNGNGVEDYPFYEPNSPNLNGMSSELFISMELQNSVESFNKMSYHSSVTSCLKVLQVDPENELALVRLGSAYYAIGGLDKYALKAWRKAMEINPKNTDIKGFIDKLEKRGY